MQLISPGVSGFATPEEMLSSARPDVVHICTPPHTHAPLAMMALNAGCHIYVEKPFTEESAQAEAILALAEAKGLRVCAGHQLLYESPTRVLRQYLPAVGRVAHVESYFSFRTVRHAPGGRNVLRADLQLLDILPHPVYLLLDVLERTGSGEVELTSLEVSHQGTVHALIRRGAVTGVLVVTLEGRPVESFLRVIGSNGSLFADYVRSTVQRSIGPGTSGIDKLFAPYRQARQVFFGSTMAFARRILKRQTSYPGLVELFTAFYAAARSGTASPLSPQSLRDTVRICEQVKLALAASEAAVLASMTPRPLDGRGVVVTGGTGFLGKEIVRSLLARGRTVRVVARRAPPAWERMPEVDYAIANIAEDVPASLFQGADTVIHAAAETAGGWEEHQRNSLDATEKMIGAASRAGIRHFIHISSLAVQSRGGRKPIRDDDPLEPNSKGAGPYVWGKLESERLARKLGEELPIEVRVVRPAALVDFREFEPPGRLGKRLGNIFVAVGSPGQRLGTVDVAFAGRLLAWMADSWEQLPTQLNLLDPVQPTKRDLLKRLRTNNPDLGVIWLPAVILHPLSWFAIALQKVLRPRKPAINVAKVFSVASYDTSRVAELSAKMEGAQQAAPIA